MICVCDIWTAAERRDSLSISVASSFPDVGLRVQTEALLLQHVFPSVYCGFSVQFPVCALFHETVSFSQDLTTAPLPCVCERASWHGQFYFLRRLCIFFNTDVLSSKWRRLPVR